MLKITYNTRNRSKGIYLVRSFLLEYTKRDEELKSIDDGSSQFAESDITADVLMDLHINLWGINAQSSEKSPKMVLDFGFMIDDIKRIKNLILYCPFHIEKVEDLGGLLSENPDLIEAIFNENCEIQSKIHPNRTKVTKRGDDFKISSSKQDEFILYKLDKALINIRNEDEYGRIEINVSDILAGNEKKIEYLQDVKKYYLRIRILPKDDKVICVIKRESEKSNILQDVLLRTTEIIDFRINDFRSITEQMKEEVFRLNTFNISSIHYLIMRSSTDEYIASAEKYKSRLLENEVWNKYITLSKNDIIAYHFKDIVNSENEYISSFANLSRFKYPLNIKERVCVYMGVISLISIISSLVASLLIRG
ncbi:hypothetical protein X875_560 [Mannheimia varigena USDA-ARS-USMARC-1388]|uniref:hypothetical protein n=1 Tax=Mannheimia varigena TaxID=85404 RepID=UPI0003E3539F|nr:hypothetical protein [Mannheimia varigena]AHG78678.1 hypothetical protein X875_560 [Mannheimia varigena USDA-ARS-USMARC-1388]